MITHATGLSKFLGKIRSLAGLHKAEDEDYFIGGGIGVTTVGQHKMEISDYKPTSKPLSNKVRLVECMEVFLYKSFFLNTLSSAFN